MKELPLIMFSTDSKIVSEHMVLSNMPGYQSHSELENAFFSALAIDERRAFHSFCSTEAVITRIFPLINFYPYHFAFAEKVRIESEIIIIVFLAENTEQLHSLMLPISEALREVTNRLIQELKNISGYEKITYLTPESILAITHTKSFDSFINSEIKNTSYCDLPKLISRVSESFSAKEIYSDIRFELSHRGTDQNIIEIPCAPLVYVLCSVLALMHALSADKTIKISTYKFAYAGEITIETHSSVFDKLPRVCSSISDLASAFPSVSSIAQSATVVSILSEIILSVDVDRVQDSIKVTIGVGFDYQSEPNFKFSDPYSEIDSIVKEAFDIFDTIK